MQSGRVNIAVAISLALCACTPMSTTVVPEPAKITLTEGLLSVVESIKEARKKTEGDRLDLVPCEISVNFKIGVTGGDKTSLGIDLSRTIATPPITSVISPSAGYDGSMDANRSNDIIMKFTHISCLKNDTVAALDEDKKDKIKRWLNKSPSTLKKEFDMNPSLLDDLAKTLREK